MREPATVDLCPAAPPRTIGGATAGRIPPRPAQACRVLRLPLGEEDVRPTFRRERAALKRGVWPVAGCDEAGRGPLAGPGVAAAGLLDPKRIPKGIEDSKRLKPGRAAGHV